MQATPLPSAAMKNENGFVLITALLILLLLMVIGIAATTSSILELQVSGADRIHTETFFRADSGVQLAALLIEENQAVRDFGGFRQLVELGGFKVLQDPDALEGPAATVIGTIDLWANQGNLGQAPEPTDAERDIGYFPDGFDPASANTAPRANITVAGFTDLLPGYGAATMPPPTQTIYTIRSRYSGRSQSETEIEARWRHMDGKDLPPRL